MAKVVPVVGTWAWDPTHRKVRHRLLPGRLDRTRHTEVRRAAARLSRLLRTAVHQ